MLSHHIAEKGVGKNPCYKCQERQAGCHATCERYTTWREAKTEFTKENMGAHMRDRAADEFLIAGRLRGREVANKAKMKRRRK